MSLNEQQKLEIKEQQKQKNITKRVVAPKLEEILYEAIPCFRSWICESNRLYG